MSEEYKSTNIALDLKQDNLVILDEFIMASPAPIYTAAKLSRAFNITSTKYKEHSISLVECGQYCETTCVDLLKICRLNLLKNFSLLNNNLILNSCSLKMYMIFKILQIKIKIVSAHKLSFNVF